jgi:hypothetical protein
MFNKWAKGDKSAIQPDLRAAVYSIVIKNGGKQEVYPLFNLLTSSGRHFTK